MPVGAIIKTTLVAKTLGHIKKVMITNRECVCFKGFICPSNFQYMCVKYLIAVAYCTLSIGIGVVICRAIDPSILQQRAHSLVRIINHAPMSPMLPVSKYVLVFNVGKQKQSFTSLLESRHQANRYSAGNATPQSCLWNEKGNSTWFRLERWRVRQGLIVLQSNVAFVNSGSTFPAVLYKN